ncbi:MAG: putative carbamoyl transferase, carbamoyltransferase [Fibrobacteres bacterium]|nr:putative carbamoyl transferase, carbamoyltransferase [Fibrobacterota bacterium]
MYILGISCHYHDSAATLLKDGLVVAAAEEERFSRRKHDAGFPLAAIRWCLESQGIGIDQIDHIAFYEKPFLKFERILRQHLDNFPRSFKTFHMAMPKWLTEKIRIRSVLKKQLGYRGDVLYVDHHLSHAAGAFLPSPFEEAAIVTVDGVGEWTTTAYGMGRGSSVELLRDIRFPHSLGLLYSAITAYLGFSVNNSEYKVMGLSPYGRMDRSAGRGSAGDKAANPMYSKLRQVIDIHEDGSYRLDMDYFLFQHSDRMPAERLCRLLGGPVRRPEEELLPRHKDVAAAVQMITEDVVLAILRHAHHVTGCPNVVLSGGVALNSVCNGRILAETEFKNIWIQPNAGDAGNSMGAALFAHCAVLGRPRSYRLDHAYLGPEFSGAEIGKFLSDKGIRHSRFASREALVSEAARLLHAGQVVGWFQGRMEWGPRALGARSILADPGRPDMQAILNEKVKHREAFRPFAPAVCAEDADEYFQCDSPLPLPADFMLMVYPIREKWRARLPAVTHVDGTGRLQTVRRAANPLYYDLIKEFGTLSGIPMLVNTSFNIRGEPIVCTPGDAYRCMMGTGIDCLFIGDFLVRREDNSKDIWDSESVATD